jgi:hypothetical protein
MREMDNCVPIEFMDEFEELEPFNSLTYESNSRQLDCPTYGVSAFEQLCKLCIIMDRGICGLYSETSLSKEPSDLLRILRDLRADLTRWRDQLPAHLSIRFDDIGSATVLPHTLSLL